MRWNEIIKLDEAVFTGFDDIPDWTGQNFGSITQPTAPVAEYQKRTRHADKPIHAWVFKKNSKFYLIQGDNEQEFNNPQKLGEFLDKNGFIDFVGVTQVNL